MNLPWKTILFWTPRVLGVLFAGFLSIFALDVFGEGYSTWQTVFALGMHLIPTLIVLGTVAVSWRWGWLGSALFLALAVFYVVSTRGHMHWSAYAAIAGPLLVIGVLFLVDWLYRGRISAAP